MTFKKSFIFTEIFENTIRYVVSYCNPHRMVFKRLKNFVIEKCIISIYNTEQGLSVYQI